jgi:flagellin
MNNAESAVSMMSLTEKAMDEMSNILDIIKTKAVEMATDTTTNDGKTVLKDDIIKFIHTFDDIVEQTNYNGIHTLKDDTVLKFQVGCEANETITYQTKSMYSSNLGLWGDIFKVNNFVSGFQGTGNLLDFNALIGEASYEDNGDYIISDFSGGYELR